MKRALKGIALGRLGVILCACLLAAPAPARADADQDLPTRVGRVGDYAGELFLAPQDRASEWATIGINYPITSGDNLWVTPEGRAEIDFGFAQVRLAGDTNLQISTLDDHRFALFIAAGRVILRLRSVDPGEAALVETPHTQIQIERPGLYRIEVMADRQQTVVAVREGEAEVRFAGGAQQALPGFKVTVTGLDAADIAVQNGFGVDGFDGWSAVRDRGYDTSTAAAYVSPEMPGAAALDNYGAWESYPTYGNVWFPTTVAVGWAPYRFGRWIWLWPWGWTWVDDAPWGYAPFHYGRWVWVSGRWGWCPGAYVRRQPWAPALVAWYGGPGWGFSGSFGVPVYGWVPVSWGEPFWPHWRCSAKCWRALHQPFAVGLAERPAGPPMRFSNANVPGGMSLVSGSVLAGGKPVAANQIRVPPSLAGTAPLLTPGPAVHASAPPVAHRPLGAPPAAASLSRPTAIKPETVKPGVGNAVPSSAPVKTAPARVAAPAAPTPDRGGRTVSAPPARELAAPPTLASRGTSVPAQRTYGGVTDGRGAYTGLAPTPGPKQAVAVERGVPIPPTLVHATPAPHAAPGPTTPPPPAIVAPVDPGRSRVHDPGAHAPPPATPTQAAPTPAPGPAPALK